MKRILHAHGIGLPVPHFLSVLVALGLSLFFTTNVSAQSITATRNVENTTHCSNGRLYGTWLNFNGLNNYYEISNSQFIEYDNGTATLNGRIINRSDSDIQFDLDILFSGRTSSEPAGSPKLNECYSANTDDWYYYEYTSGTITGVGDASGAVISISRRGPAYQVGVGANVTNAEAFGASGWFDLTVEHQPSGNLKLDGKNGDFNILLSEPNSPDCINIPSEIKDFAFIGEFNNSKYFISNDNEFTWAQAKSIAEDNGGHLVVINDALENQFVKNALNKKDGWIGLTDELVEGDFVWVNGDPTDYTNWRSGEPNNQQGKEHYARILRSSGKWTDRNAKYKSCIIMEIPCEPITPSKEVKIGDMVWDDLNGNGLMDAGEPGIGGVQVELVGLTTTGDGVSQIRFTNDDGKYLFEGLQPGNYKVIFSNVPGGYFATAKNEGADDSIDSDVDPINGMTEPKDYVGGEVDLDVDAGYFRKADIGDFVWHDLNGDGIRDLAEPGIPDITVLLTGTDGLGNPVNESTHTNNVGIYFFNGLLPGDYKLTFVPTGDYVPTKKDEGADDTIDSDLDPITLMTGIETLVSGESNNTYDAGLILPVKIGGVIFIDNNNNGLNDTGDANPSNVVVDLLKLNTATNDYEFFDTRTTGSDGKFIFNDLPPCTYKIDVDGTTLPSGFFFTPFMNVNGNSNDDIDSDVDAEGEISNIVIISGQADDCNYGAGIIDQNILPVELVRFTAEVVNSNEVLLKWVTESEENNKHFIVERSTDGERFEIIGTVEGNGTTASTSVYQYLDEAPYFGRNYYRLKQVDFNGRFEFSEVVSVTIEGNDLPDAIVYPNPAETHTVLRMVEPLEQDATLEVISSLGEVMHTIDLPVGTNSYRVDLQNYHAGFYFIHLSYDGNRRLVQRVLKIQE